jgi:hypothetical protein
VESTLIYVHDDGGDENKLHGVSFVTFTETIKTITEISFQNVWQMARNLTNAVCSQTGKMTRLINEISKMDSKSWIQLLNISGLVSSDMSSNII